ncbi:MAG: hypothetical protein U1F36_00160 [Planctomycetota bacterium]
MERCAHRLRAPALLLVCLALLASCQARHCRDLTLCTEEGGRDVAVVGRSSSGTPRFVPGLSGEQVLRASGRRIACGLESVLVPSTGVPHVEEDPAPALRARSELVAFRH